MSMMADIRSWWANRPPRTPLHDIELAEREALARDLGLDRDTLERIAASGPQAGRELHRMLVALKLDPEVVKKREPVLIRDMSMTYSTCLTVRDCRKHLDRGVARAVYQYTCPKAASIAMLEAQDWSGAPARSDA